METREVIYRNQQKMIQIYSPSPIVFERAQGMYLFDKTGKGYLDFSAQFSACSLGHCNEELNEAIIKQLQKMFKTLYTFFSPSQFNIRRQTPDF